MSEFKLGSFGGFVYSFLRGSTIWPGWHLQLRFVVGINDSSQQIFLDLRPRSCNPIALPILPLQMVMAQQLVAEFSVSPEILSIPAVWKEAMGYS